MKVGTKESRVVETVIYLNKEEVDRLVVILSEYLKDNGHIVTYAASSNLARQLGREIAPKHFDSKRPARKWKHSLNEGDYTISTLRVGGGWVIKTMPFGGRQYKFAVYRDGKMVFDTLGYSTEEEAMQEAEKWLDEVAALFLG